MIEKGYAHDEESRKAFGNRLRELRKLRGFSINQAVNALKISRSTYTSWELGNRVPLTKSLKNIADLYDTHESYLMLTSDSIEPPNTSLDGYIENVEKVTYKDKELTPKQIEELKAYLEDIIHES